MQFWLRSCGFCFWLHKFVGATVVGALLGALLGWGAAQGISIPAAQQTASAANDYYRIALLNTVGGNLGASIIEIVVGIFVVCMITHLKTKKST